MLRCGQAVKSAPDAGRLVASLLLLLTMSTLFLITEEFIELCNLRLAVLATAFAQTPNLLIAQFIIRRVDLWLC